MSDQANSDFSENERFDETVVEETRQMDEIDAASDSDEAPEEVSLATGRTAIVEQMRSEKQAQIQ